MKIQRELEKAEDHIEERLKKSKMGRARYKYKWGEVTSFVVWVY